MTIKEIIAQSKKGAKPEDIMGTLASLVEQVLQEKTKPITEEMNRKMEETVAEIKQKMGAAGDKLIQEIKDYVINFVEMQKVLVKGDQGIQGEPGMNGKDGKNGTDGENGADAVVDYQKIVNDVLEKIGEVKDTPNEIISKINTVKEKISMFSIKGLLSELENIKKAIRQKGGGGTSGGGMGNPQHESKSLSASTTSVQTNYKISANGFGLIGVYFQGQQVARGVGYTVGGDFKTINLLFTPVDGTFLDIVYIRG